MGMFDNYQNLNPSYIPNNKNKSLESYEIFNDSLPQCEYNLKHQFVAYKWKYGETFNITFSANNIVYVEENAIIYTETGLHPTENTIGLLNQKAYNIVDKICWICETQDQTIFNWKQLDNFLIPICGSKAITLDYDDELLHIFNLKILDFRGNIIFEQDSEELTSNITLNIRDDLAEKLLPNIYKCIINIDNQRIKEVYLNVI